MRNDAHKERGQLSFSWPVLATYTEEEFLVSPSNEEAYQFIQKWPHWSSPILCLKGPKGSGKTHLSSIWLQKSGAYRVSAIDLISADLPLFFANKALVVEDVLGAYLDQRALFHLLNFAKETESFVLMTTTQDPNLWGITLKDLSSRLQTIPRVEIGLPDDALLRGVLVKLFTDRQLIVDEAVLSYILVRMHRSFDEARKLVAEIDHQALKYHTSITRRFVASLFKNDEKEEVEP